MKQLFSLSVCVALVASASLVVAAELSSGLQPGNGIGAFDVVKCSGAADDGVSVGDQLCYRCKYGSRPMVMVFARTADKNLAMLVKQLDAVVTKNEDSELKAFVNLLGEDRDELEGTAKELGSKNKVVNVPIVVPVEFENGPADYGINPEADVTVIIASKAKVVANHAVASGELNEKSIAAILADVTKLVK